MAGAARTQLWWAQAFMITFVGLVKAAHCIGLEIILQSS